MVDSPTPETEPTPEETANDAVAAAACGHADKNGRVCVSAPHTGQHSYKPKPDPSGESAELTGETYDPVGTHDLAAYDWEDAHDPVSDTTLARVADALEQANRLQAAALLLSQHHIGFTRDGRATENARQVVIDTLK